jgi:ribose 1,5-bisphosphokinase PhnN
LVIGVATVMAVMRASRSVGRQLLLRPAAAAGIVSANLARRNLTKGQQAMALAMIYPKSEQGSRTDLKQTSLETKQVNFSAARLSQARTVLHNAPDLASLVLAGTRKLDEAYTEARGRRSLQEVCARFARAAEDSQRQVRFVASTRIDRDEITPTANPRTPTPRHPGFGESPRPVEIATREVVLKPAHRP